MTPSSKNVRKGLTRDENVITGSGCKGTTTMPAWLRPCRCVVLTTIQSCSCETPATGCNNTSDANYQGVSDPRTGLSGKLGWIRDPDRHRAEQAIAGQGHTARKEQGQEMAWEDKEQTDFLVTAFLIFLV